MCVRDQYNDVSTEHKIRIMMALVPKKKRLLQFLSLTSCHIVPIVLHYYLHVKPERSELPVYLFIPRHTFHLLVELDS